jgi:hypothetical protein
MFHDVGLLEGHRSEHERLEIDGANAARAFLERPGRIARDATDLIRSVESDLLYHHSLRVYSWGALRGALRGLRYATRALSDPDRGRSRPLSR